MSQDKPLSERLRKSFDQVVDTETATQILNCIMPVIAALEAENARLKQQLDAERIKCEAMRKACIDVLNERDTELDMMRCIYRHDTPENKAWHDGVYECWERIKIVKKELEQKLDALAEPAQPQGKE